MFLRVHGNRFATQDGPVRLRGIDLGCHLNLEHFMLGIPGTDSEIRFAFESAFGEARLSRFGDTYNRDYVNGADFSFLKKAPLPGADSLRHCKKFPSRHCSARSTIFDSTDAKSTDLA